MRKTGSDYRREYNELKQSEKSLDVHLISRLLELSKIYPDAIMIGVGDSGVTAKHINKKWIESCSIEARILLIENIEKWSAEQNKAHQTKMKI
jgi:hypothetical protein